MKVSHASPADCFRGLGPRLIKAPPLVSEFCKSEMLGIIDCSRTITGTHKDFRSAALLGQCGGADPVFYSITMGNAGYSLGKLAGIYNKLAGGNVRVVNVIDARLDRRVRNELEAVSIVLQADLRGRVLPAAELLGMVRGEVKAMGPFIHAETGHFAYKRLVEKALCAGAGVIVLPVGSGELLDSFLKGLAASVAAGLRVPSIIAVTVRDNIFSGEQPGWIPGCGSIADKLVSPASMFFDSVMGRIGNFRVRVGAVSDPEIMEAFQMLKKSGIRSEPSAAAAFAGLRKSELRAGEKVLVVNTGYGLHYE
jgi:hypothetical protein